MPDSLTTIDAVKTWLNVSGNADDELLNRLIAAWSATALGYLNRSSILSRSITETYSGTGGTSMILRQWPVTALASLSIDGNVVTASNPAPTGTGYLIELYDGVGPGQPSELALIGKCFTRNRMNVSVGYTAGYAEIPADIENAVIELVGLTYREKSRIGEVSRSVGGQTISFTQKAMPADVQMMLSPYRMLLPI